MIKSPISQSLGDLLIFSSDFIIHFNNAAAENSHTPKLCFFLHGNLHHNGAFHSLFEKLASVFIHAADIAGRMISIGCAAAAAVQSGPAVTAFFAGIDIAHLEVLSHRFVGNAVPDIAHFVLFIADKLVTRVQVAPWRHCKILRTGAAA